MVLPKENIIAFFKDKPIIRLYLFGSYSRLEQTKDSDIDLLVEWDYSQKIDLFDVIGWQWDLEAQLGRKVDLLCNDGISPFMKPFIEKDKILLYEK
jgi:predicted nucleotidyltransferase